MNWPWDYLAGILAYFIFVTACGLLLGQYGALAATLIAIAFILILATWEQT